MPTSYRRRAVHIQLPTTASVLTREISANAVYPLNGFRTASGISEQRMQRAKREGVTCTTFRIGKRVFIDGAEAIKYIKALAELHKQQQPAIAAKQASEGGKK